MKLLVQYMIIFCQRELGSSERILKTSRAEISDKFRWEYNWRDYRNNCCKTFENYVYNLFE